MNKAQKVLSVPDKLYDVFPRTWAGAIVRGVRVAVGIVMSVVVATVADGSVFNEVHIINPDQVPLAVAVLTPIITAADKWLRDHGLEEPQEPAEPPTAGNPAG